MNWLDVLLCGELCCMCVVLSGVCQFLTLLCPYLIGRYSELVSVNIFMRTYHVSFKILDKYASSTLKSLVLKIIKM